MSFHPQLFAAADQAVEYVRRRIENGVFVPGQRLPPERELARQNIYLAVRARNPARARREMDAHVVASLA